MIINLFKCVCMCVGVFPLSFCEIKVSVSLGLLTVLRLGLEARGNITDFFVPHLTFDAAFDELLVPGDIPR